MDFVPEKLCSILDSLPESDERAELMRLLHLGIAFASQHQGRRPGPIAALVRECVQRARKPWTFEKLLQELNVEAKRREYIGEQASIVEKVDHGFELVTLWLPGAGRVQRTFSALAWHFTNAKKSLENETEVSP